MPPLINPNSNAKLTPIGLNLPITRDYNGYFSQTFDTISQTKANIRNLLNTKKGERRFQPLFGSGLHSALFEQNLDSTPDVLKDIINNDIRNWVPNINIVDVELSLSSDDANELKDTYKVYIKVTFIANNTVDSVDLILQQTRT